MQTLKNFYKTKFDTVSNYAIKPVILVDNKHKRYMSGLDLYESLGYLDKIFHEARLEILCPQFSFVDNGLISHDRFSFYTQTYFLHNLSKHQSSSIFGPKNRQFFVKVAELSEILENPEYRSLVQQTLTFDDNTDIVFFDYSQISQNSKSNLSRNISICKEVPEIKSNIATYTVSFTYPSLEDFVEFYESSLKLNPHKTKNFEFLMLTLERYFKIFK